MLNISPLHDPHYHLRAVTHDASAYYLREGEAPGRWAGQGAPLRGLAGEVSPQDLVDLFAGKDPVTGDWLISARGSAARAGDRAGLRYLDTEAAAAALELTPKQVTARLRSGRLAGVKDAHGRWQIPTTAIDACREGKRQPKVKALPAPGPDGLFSTTDAAAIAGCSRQYLDKIATSAAPERTVRDDGTPVQYLVAVKDERGRWRVPPGELERFVASRSVPGAVPAYDLALRAPKSVSLLHDLGHLVPRSTLAKLGLEDGATVASEVAAAHRAAVDDVVAFLESHAAFVRSHGTREEAKGLTVAVFDHRSSREGDPLLHSHLVVINAADGVDGITSALDGATLYQFARAGGHIYQARLRRELSRRLGVEWETPHHGVADLVGVPRDVVEAFSLRQRQIVRHMEAIGAGDARSAQAAALATRRPKDPERGVAPEVTAQRAASLGFEATDVAALVGREQHPPLSPTDLAAIAAQLAGPEGLTARRARVDLRDAVCALADAMPAGATGSELVELARRLLYDSERFVPVMAGPGGRETLRRKDGRSVRAGVALQKFSTPELLAHEARLLALHTEGRGIEDQGVGWGVATPAGVTGAIAAFPTLSDEQERMVRRVTTSGWGIDVVIGRPGSGKTSAGVAAARAAWAHSGLRVIGTSLQGGAKEQLRAVAGLTETHTLTGLLRRCEREGPAALRGAVVVVDEVGMADTRQLSMLAAHAHVARAKLVLVGDPDQIPEVGAGGALRALVEILGDDITLLAENRRQRHPADRQRLEDIRTGRTEEAVASYQAEGLWRAEASADATREALLRAWWDDEGRPGIDKIMAAPTVPEVEWLNRAARTLRKSRGELGGPALTVAQSAPDRPVEAREFAVGDAVLAQRNWAARGIFTGQRGSVTAVDAAAGTLTVELSPDGDDVARSVVLDRSYLEDRLRPGPRRAIPAWDRAGLAHAYASTVNGVQGLTTETAYALASTAIYNQLAYVAASRARERTTWFALTAPDPDELEPTAPATAELDPDDMAALVAAMTRDATQTMAIRDDPRAAAAGELMRRPTSWLWAERRELEAKLGRPVPALQEGLRQVRAALADYYGLDLAALECAPLTQALTRALRVPGATPERVAHLTMARGRRTPRELVSAEDPLAVLVWAVSDHVLETLRADAAALHEADARPAEAASRDAQLTARIAVLDSAIGRQRIGRLELARCDTAGPIQLLLGPAPNDAVGLRAWRRGAAAITDYRDTAGLYDRAQPGADDVAIALGSRPEAGTRAAHYDQVLATVARCRADIIVAGLARHVPPAPTRPSGEVAVLAASPLSELHADLASMAPAAQPDPVMVARLHAAAVVEAERLRALVGAARVRLAAGSNAANAEETRRRARRRPQPARTDANLARSEIERLEAELTRAVASVEHYKTLAAQGAPVSDGGRRGAVEQALAVRERNLRAGALTDPPPWLRRHVAATVAADERPDLAELATVYGDIAVYRERWAVLEPPALAAPEPGTIRLWHVEPAEIGATGGRLPERNAGQPDGKVTESLRGRRFTSEPADLEAFANEIIADGGAPRTYYVDVATTEAPRYAMAANGHVRPSSASPKTDYLLPPELAASKRAVVAEAPVILADLLGQLPPPGDPRLPEWQRIAGALDAALDPEGLGLRAGGLGAQ